MRSSSYLLYAYQAVSTSVGFITGRVGEVPAARGSLGECKSTQKGPVGWLSDDVTGGGWVRQDRPARLFPASLLNSIEGAVTLSMV